MTLMTTKVLNLFQALMGDIVTMILEILTVFIKEDTDITAMKLCSFNFS